MRPARVSEHDPRQGAAAALVLRSLVTAGVAIQRCPILHYQYILNFQAAAHCRLENETAAPTFLPSPNPALPGRALSLPGTPTIASQAHGTRTIIDTRLLLRPVRRRETAPARISTVHRPMDGVPNVPLCLPCQLITKQQMAHHRECDLRAVLISTTTTPKHAVTWVLIRCRLLTMCRFPLSLLTWPT